MSRKNGAGGLEADVCDAALNQLKGMVIAKYALVTNNVAYNVEGEVMIPNPSVVTIQMVGRPPLPALPR